MTAPTLYVYRLGVDGRVDRSDLLLLHERRFTVEEFEDLVAQVTPLALRTLMTRWTQSHTERYGAPLHQAEVTVCFGHLAKDIVAKLCLLHGFRKLEVTASVYGPASGDLRHRPRGTEARQRLCTKIFNRLAEHHLTLAAPARKEPAHV